MSHSHLSIDVGEEALYWMRSNCRRGGLLAASWGVEPRSAETSPGAQIRRLLDTPWGRRCRVELSFRSVSLVREALPQLTHREALLIASRRSKERLQRPLDSDCLGVARRRGRHDDPIWICAADPVEVEEEVERWSRQNVRVDRLQGRSFALGNAARVLAHPAEQEVVALVDLELDRGTCVVADRHGWLFSREMPLRFMGERRIRRPAAESAADGEPSGLLLVGESEDPEKEEDAEDHPFHWSVELAERLTTELRRTFTYAQGELRLGNVGRVVVSGERPGLEEIAGSLEANLGLPTTTFGAACSGEVFAGLPNGAAAALGLACAPDCEGGNLLPRALIERGAQLLARRRLVRALAASLVAAVLGVGGGGLLLARMRVQLAHLEALWREGAAERAMLTDRQHTQLQLDEIASAFSHIERPAPPWTALLMALGHLMPERAHLLSFGARFEEGVWHHAISVEAEGATVSEAARSVSELAGALAASPLLTLNSAKREEASYQSERSDDLGRVRFRIEGALAEKTGAPASGEGRG